RVNRLRIDSSGAWVKSRNSTASSNHSTSPKTAPPQSLPQSRPCNSEGLFRVPRGARESASSSNLTAAIEVSVGISDMVTSQNRETMLSRFEHPSERHFRSETNRGNYLHNRIIAIYISKPLELGCTVIDPLTRAQYSNPSLHSYG